MHFIKTDAENKIVKQTQNNNLLKERIYMATNNSNQPLVPQAREALNRFKMEAASEVGVTLKQGYNGDLTSRQAGSIGGQIVKKVFQQFENGLANGSINGMQ